MGEKYDTLSEEIKRTPYEIVRGSTGNPVC